MDKGPKPEQVDSIKSSSKESSSSLESLNKGEPADLNDLPFKGKGLNKDEIKKSSSIKPELLADHSRNFKS